MESSFLGGVTRTLNISYLRAIPVGEYALPPFSNSYLSNQSPGSF